MAVAVLPFCDSFDHYSGNGSIKWTAGGTSANIDLTGTASRTGIGCIELPSGSEGPLLQIPPLTRVVIGTAFYPGAVASTPKSQIMNLEDLNTNGLQVRVCALPDMSILLLNGGDPFPRTLGNSAPGVLAVNAYNYVEVDAQISHSASIIVRVNGVVVLSLSGVDDIDTGANIFANGWRLKGFGGGATSRHDDVYCLDPGAAGMGAAFLGAVRIYAVVPTSDGSPVGWTPLSGTNFSQVAEIPPDNDTSYNFSGVVGTVDQYVYQLSGPPANSAIKFVQHTMDMKVDSGAATVASDAGGSVSPGNALTSSYVMYARPYLVNPGSANPWVAGDFPAQFGPKLTA